MSQNAHHQYRNLGGWTFAFEDYYDLNLTAHFDDPRMVEMASIIDPYGEMSTHHQLVVLYIHQQSSIGPAIAYKDRLTMPKLMVCASGDEFFQNDDSWYFWDDLPGEKFIR